MNETSKENSIEGVIEILKRYIEKAKKMKEDEWSGFYNDELKLLGITIEHILADRERLQKQLDNSISKDTIKEKLMKYFDINTENCDCYHLTRVKEARNYGTLTINDFVEFDEDTIDDITKFLLEESEK